MKLRIKGNTLRLRLTKSELEYFEKTNFIEEKTVFGSSIFSYSLCAENIDTLTATLENNKIIVRRFDKLVLGSKRPVSARAVGIAFFASAET